MQPDTKKAPSAGDGDALLQVGLAGQVIDKHEIAHHLNEVQAAFIARQGSELGLTAIYDCVVD